MRRILFSLVLLAVVGAAGYYVLSGRGSDPAPRYTVELDNAFGIVTGADLKVAGVRAGKIAGLRVDPKSHRALVDFEISQDGFGSLRKDVFCESRPQSLIGEYYLDCKPGTSKEKLARGSTIPVEQTASTIPLDLVNNVLRKPYRERLGIILDELGIGVAGRAQDINDVIRRASPALRETDKVLEKLARQNETLKQLVTDADAVVGDLAANKRDVGRFVVETKETAAASAERRDAIAGQPAPAAHLPARAAPDDGRAGLGRRRQHARAREPQRVRRPARDAAGERQAVRGGHARSTSTRWPRPRARAARRSAAARPVVAELAKATEKAPELANNAAIVLEHLDDRKHAAEKDPRSPGGEGYTGFEAVLQWLFDQSQAINIYDQNGYILKIDLFFSKCSDYQNLQTLKAKMKSDPSFYKDCAAILGPNQPGITTPDPTSTGRQFASAGAPQAKAEAKAPEKKAPESRAAGDRQAQAAGRRQQQVDKPRRRTTSRTSSTRPSSSTLRRDAIKRLRDAARKGTQDVGKLRERLEEQLGIKLPPLDKLKLPEPPKTPQAPSTPNVPVPSFPTPAPTVPERAGRADVPDPTGQLLDYLFAP